MGIDVDISEVRAISSRLATAGGRVGAKAAAALTKTAYDIEADAKEFSEVDTGAQRNSISTTLSGDGRFGAMSAEIGPTTEYSPYREFGTSIAAAHPFMGPAFDRRMPAYMDALGDIAAKETL
jgi:HK97 gp10 family phage protein